jgi:hypothetical protein
VLRALVVVAVPAIGGFAPACWHGEQAASKKATTERPFIQNCVDLWNARENQANQKLIAAHFTNAAVYSWKIKTGDYGCSVSVVRSNGRWLQWGNTIPALEGNLDWSKPVAGANWGVDTPEPLPRLNASIRPNGKVMLQ